MFEQIKRTRFTTRMQLREVHKITEWKGGCIFKTKSLGLIICPSDYKLLDMSNIQIGSVSTRISKEIM